MNATQESEVSPGCQKSMLFLPAGPSPATVPICIFTPQALAMGAGLR